MTRVLPRKVRRFRCDCCKGMYTVGVTNQIRADNGKRLCDLCYKDHGEEYLGSLGPCLVFDDTDPRR